MASSGEDNIFDEMLSFLGEPMFQVPVNSFMDEQCLIFDPGQEPLKEHKEVFKTYCKMVDALLKAFCEDSKMSQEDVVTHIKNLNNVPNLKDTFNTCFEQVLATTNYNLFHTLMSRRNLLIQEQVLSLILASTGAIPASMMHDPVVITCSHVDDEEAAGGSGKNVKNQLKPSDKKLSSKKSSKLHDSNREGGGSKSRGGHANAEKAVGMDYLKVEAVNEDTLEKEVMQKILRTSTENGESMSVAACNREVSKVRQERKDLEERMRKLMLSKEDQDNDSLLKQSAKKSLHTKHGVVNAEDVKKRQEFFRQQRDQLIKMKTQARHKLLEGGSGGGDDGDRLKNRPVSARTARILMVGGDADKKKKDGQDDNQMALRRTIAEKLKKEVLRK